jgi:hypothetical protein
MAPNAESGGPEATICRVGCGACCVAPSISSPIPGLPDGKPAGMRCPQLTTDGRCRLFGRPERPGVCRNLRPTAEMCGTSAREAFVRLTRLERATVPARVSVVGVGGGR